MQLCDAQAFAVAAIGRWSETLDDLVTRIAHRFRRVEVRERVKRYLVGLLDRVERKNGWQLAEAIGESGPQGVTTPPECRHLGHRRGA